MDSKIGLPETHKRRLEIIGGHISPPHEPIQKKQHIEATPVAAPATSNSPPHLQPADYDKKGQTAEKKLSSSRQIGVFNVEQSALNTTDITVEKIQLHTVPHLRDKYPDLPAYPNVYARTRVTDPNTPALCQSRRMQQQQAPATKVKQEQQSQSQPLPASSVECKVAATASATPDQSQYIQLIDDDEVVLLDIVRKRGLSTTGKGFVRAGPRKNIVWQGAEVKAAIVTCGGLCPGLNDVIEELVNSLYYNYGVDTIYGIRNGYRGFWDNDPTSWMKLTPQTIEGIHTLGGTILGASRGGFELDKIMDACVERGVNQIFIVGGDGTHRGAAKLAAEALRRGIKMTVGGVPKTIDNDIGIIDKSFGFDTAVSEAVKAIHSAVVEARCAPNGIGIVQLMGRHAGYIAAHATLAFRQVDLCLIPEVPFPLYGPNGIMNHLENVIKIEGRAVIVVAEGAGQEHLKATGKFDESGNPVLPEIGLFLKSEINRHFSKLKVPVNIKYHDPSYMIRSVPAHAGDSVFCAILAQNAVHAAMAGYTAFTVAVVNNRTVILPISLITAVSPSYLNPHGRTWERVISVTQQPNWVYIHDQEREKAAAASKISAPPTAGLKVTQK